MALPPGQTQDPAQAQAQAQAQAAAIQQFFTLMDQVLSNSLLFQIGTLLNIITAVICFIYFFKFVTLVIKIPRPIYIALCFTPALWFLSALSPTILWIARPHLTDFGCLVVSRAAAACYLCGKTIVDTLFLTRVKAFYGIKSPAFILVFILFLLEDFGVQVYNIFTIQPVRDGWFICLPDTPRYGTILHIVGTLLLTTVLQSLFLYRIFKTASRMDGTNQLSRVYQALMKENLQYATIIIVCEIIVFSFLAALLDSLIGPLLFLFSLQLRSFSLIL